MTRREEPSDISPAIIADLRPSAGARFVLLRGAHEATRATYAAAIISPGWVWHYHMELSAGTQHEPVISTGHASPHANEATLSDRNGNDLPIGEAPDCANPSLPPASPAAADVDMLTMIARLTARAAPTRATDGLTPWPPRIVRWRGPGRGG